jgi:prepilin-type N-terminal cleavage/methylation domain-containing protein
VTRRHGYTLIETLMALVVVSLLLMIALPRVGNAFARHSLRGARTTVVNTAALARAAAQEGTRTTWIVFEGTRTLVVARPRLQFLAGSTADTVGSVRDLAEEYGVTFAAPDSIRFVPSGLGGLGGAQTITLSHGDYIEAITMDGLGRVQK